MTVYGVTKLDKVQLGPEGTKGTEVDATSLWPGVAELTDNRQTVFPPENIGYLAQVNRSYIPYADAGVKFAEVAASFEQIGYPFAAGIQNTTTGSANGGTTNGYVYIYTAATTTLPTIKTYTIEGGDNAQEYQALYGMCTKITLKGTTKDALKISSEWIAQSLSTGSFTSNISVPTLEYALFQTGKIYCDPVSGSSGSTQLTNTFLDFDQTIETGQTAVSTANGTISYGFDKNVGTKITGTITVEHEAQGISLYNDFKNGTARIIRMDFPGTALTGTGGTFSTKLIRLEFVMKILDVKRASANGNNVVKITYQGVYDPTANLYWKMTVVNTNSTLA